MIDHKILRCAIYTRKSTEDGLEQDFNSLQAQREACEAFIRSQRSEGWVLLPAAYDDGGLSGGTLERPALKRLMAHIEEKRVDVIVVYKVDRLTRSLSDFSKMVDIFDRYGVSFVAVTQQFNTTTSMGRLTLNVLLSFAQFEREVTAERIRDKIAASKRKGIWMGGTLPRGYRVEDRKLIIVPEQAAIVRDIYARYLKSASIRELAFDLKREGITATKANASTNHKPAITRGALYALLRNPIYIGKIAHKGELSPGQHDAILDPALWQAVQEKLKTHRNGQARLQHKADDSPLRGKLLDELGRVLMHYQINKKGRRYRYYVSRPDDQDVDRLEGNTNTDWKLPAPEIERRVVEIVAVMVSQRADVARAAMAESLNATDIDALLKTIRQATTVQYLEWVERAALHSDHLTVTLRLPGRTTFRMERTVALVMKRRGRERRMVIAPEIQTRTQPDPQILKALRLGLAFWEQLNSEHPVTASVFAQQIGVDNRYIGRALSLAFVAPDIVECFVSGRQPPDWTAERLLRGNSPPLSWQEQRKAIGLI